MAAHRCVPPFMARTLGCDCSRCCSVAAHEPGCNAIPEPQPECTCPDTADYHLADCPEAEES